jgi:hypothetical protein
LKIDSFSNNSKSSRFESLLGIILVPSQLVIGPGSIQLIKLTLLNQPPVFPFILIKKLFIRLEFNVSITFDFRVFAFHFADETRWGLQVFWSGDGFLWFGELLFVDVEKGLFDVELWLESDVLLIWGGSGDAWENLWEKRGEYCLE